MAADGIIKGVFFGLPQATLTTLMATASQCLSDIMTAGQGHSITGRSMTLANIAEVRQTIAELQAALNQAGGQRVRRTLGYGGGFTR